MTSNLLVVWSNKQTKLWFSSIQTFYVPLASQRMAVGYQEHESPEASFLLGLSLQLGQCHFYHILLVKASYKRSPGSSVGTLQGVMHSSFSLQRAPWQNCGSAMSSSVPSVGWNLENSTHSATLFQARYPVEYMPILIALQSKWDSILYTHVVLTKIAFNSWLISIISFLYGDEKAWLMTFLQCSSCTWKHRLGLYI